MRVESISFKNYRNLAEQTLDPCDGVNIIYGNNAQGKTNIIEALWLFCGGHSFRTQSYRELIAFGESFAHLECAFFGQDRRQTASITIEPSKRLIKINGVEKKTSAALIEKFCAVVFSPENLSLIKRGPAERRSFIDSAICREKLRNALTLQRYNRLLKQRNALLKDISRKPYLENMLDEWDEALAQLGAVVICDRLNYLSQLQPAAEEFYFGISSGRERLSIAYEFSFSAEKETGADPTEFAALLLKALQENRRADLAAGFTTCGPHRDDFSLCINGLSARTFGSQGQKRSAALALKLGEASVLRENLGEKPVVLFDDVMSELDRSRQDYLFNRMKGWQIFITCCEPAAVLRLSEGKTFRMQQGVISEQGSAVS